MSPPQRHVASAVTAPPCLLPLPPRSFTEAGPALSSPAVARQLEERPSVPAFRLLSSPPPSLQPPPIPLSCVPPFTPRSRLFYKLFCLFLVSLHRVSSVVAVGSFLFKMWWFSVLFSWMSRTVRCQGWIPVPSMGLAQSTCALRIREWIHQSLCLAQGTSNGKPCWGPQGI